MQKVSKSQEDLQKQNLIDLNVIFKAQFTMIGSGPCQQIHLQSCGCSNTKEEEEDHLTVPHYHKNKRFSIIVEEELLRLVGEIMINMSELQTSINHTSMRITLKKDDFRGNTSIDQYLLLLDSYANVVFRNGYPSLLIVNDHRHLSCNNLDKISSEKINKTSYQVKLGTGSCLSMG